MAPPRLRHADRVRDLRLLPKAHLHLHLTGGMRPSTLVELAAAQRRHLPAELLAPRGAHVDVTVRRGWVRFQRLYDAARDLLTGPEELRRVVRELVEDEAAAGSGWLELQVDPTTYAPRVGGLQAAVELVLDALADGTRATGVGTALVLAANRTRHPAEAETLARLARRFAGRGVVGFGLSNDETRGDTAAFAKAFRLAREVGLLAVPHAGELRGPRSVRTAVEEVPVRALRAAGVGVALGADDPLVFRSGLLEQYEAVRDGARLSDADLADLARCAVRGSAAPEPVRRRLEDGIDAWLAAPPP